MPSFSSGDSIDLAHLQQMTLGDAKLGREILTMFAAQAAELIEAIAPLPLEAVNLAHKLNGSARGIGAFRVAEAAENLERVLRKDGDALEMLARLKLAVTQAETAIETMLRESDPNS